MKRATTLTAAAGEHYVAYRLSQFGYAVALTRAGAPSIDLMVGNRHGDAVSVQVKTSNDAYYKRVRNPSSSYWNWDVGEKALHAVGESLFYAFVDLQPSEAGGRPMVFIVPSLYVSTHLDSNEKRRTFSIMERDKQLYCERWDLITAPLERHDEAASAASLGASR